MGPDTQAMKSELGQLVADLQKLDKCPFCGDNEDHSLKCPVRRAKEAMRRIK
jgi:hypothetical protein